MALRRTRFAIRFWHRGRKPGQRPWAWPTPVVVYNDRCVWAGWPWWRWTEAKWRG